MRHPIPLLAHRAHDDHHHDHPVDPTLAGLARPARRVALGRWLALGTAPLLTGWPLAAAAEGATTEAAMALLRQGGVVLALRHARAPGTFDPPEFRLGDCSTQRNLDDDGRAQARRLGAALAARGLRPDAVRSSPWCRCLDTARLAFGRAEAWDALASPTGSSTGVREARLAALRAALATASATPGRFQAWVTHQFVLSDLAGVGTDSGEGLVLDLGPDGAVRIRARLPADFAA